MIYILGIFLQNHTLWVDHVLNVPRECLLYENDKLISSITLYTETQNDPLNGDVIQIKNGIVEDIFEIVSGCNGKFGFIFIYNSLLELQLSSVYIPLTNGMYNDINTTLTEIARFNIDKSLFREIK